MHHNICMQAQLYGSNREVYTLKEKLGTYSTIRPALELWHTSHHGAIKASDSFKTTVMHLAKISNQLLEAKSIFESIDGACIGTA